MIIDKNFRKCHSSVAFKLYGNLIIALAALILITTTISASAAIQVQNLEIRGNFATDSAAWDNSTFAGFFYDIKDNLGTETLTIDQTFRTIPKEGMQYMTVGQQKTLNVVSKQYAGDADKAIAAGLEQFANGSMAGVTGLFGAGNYTIVGWQGERHVAIKRKSDKLTKLLIEHGPASVDKKSLTVGETWDMAEGWTLKVNSIDALASPRQVTFTLAKDGIVKDVKVVSAGTIDAKPIYTFVETSLCGETNVPVFVTYIDSVTADMVQIRYTWLISSICSNIQSGDVFGVMKVRNLDPLTLSNSDNTVTLSQDATLNVMGDLKIKVADSSALRYYPFVLKTAPGSYEVRGSIATGSAAWDSSTFSGFFYDIKDNLGAETLTINQMNRIIGKDGLVYSTVGQPKTLNVVSKQYANNADKAIAAGLEQFANGSMAGTTGIDGAGQYTIVGWQGEKHVAIKKKPYKITKLLIEHGSAAEEKKTLTVGETWDMAEGWTLKVNSIDVLASPRQVTFTLAKDGIVKDVKVVSAGTVDAKPIYTFVETSLCGETNVPVFVTYIDSVTAEMVQIRYTWLISSICSNIQSGDVFGVMKVRNQDPLTLSNSDNTVTLAPDSIINIMGELNLSVAGDVNNLRYYPFVTYEIVSPQPLPPSGLFDTLKFESNAWNLVSVPKNLFNSNVDIALSNLSLDINNIKWYYNTSISDWEHPTNILPLRGYWVYNNASTGVTQKLTYKAMAGPNVPPSMTLKAGWNLIGHTFTQNMSVSSALISIDGKYSHLLTYSPGNGWKMYIVGNPALQQFNVFEPGKGYWIFMTQDATYAAVDV